MYWVTGISVVLNIILLMVLAVTLYQIIATQNEAFHNHTQWEKWEHRWYEAQAFISDELGYHLSPSGLSTPIVLTKHK